VRSERRVVFVNDLIKGGKPQTVTHIQRHAATRTGFSAGRAVCYRYCAGTARGLELPLAYHERTPQKRGRVEQAMLLWSFTFGRNTSAPLGTGRDAKGGDDFF
jgi:hypothetical protein